MHYYTRDGVSRHEAMEAIGGLVPKLPVNDGGNKMKTPKVGSFFISQSNTLCKMLPGGLYRDYSLVDVKYAEPLVYIPYSLFSKKRCATRQDLMRLYFRSLE